LNGDILPESKLQNMRKGPQFFGIALLKYKLIHASSRWLFSYLSDCTTVVSGSWNETSVQSFVSKQRKTSIFNLYKESEFLPPVGVKFNTGLFWKFLFISINILDMRLLGVFS
jgi:hypothetical protein